MAFKDMEDFDDEEFGFHCKRIVYNPPPSSSQPPPPPPPSSHIKPVVIDSDEETPYSLDQHTRLKMKHKKINDEYDKKSTSTRISKGKAVSYEANTNWRTSDYTTNALTLSPISPYTPPDHQQYQQNAQPLPSRSFTTFHTLSPELTGPQTAISPPPQSTTTPLPLLSPPPNRNDIYRTNSLTASNDSYMEKVETPAKTVPISDYHTLIKADLPKQERKRQLALLFLQTELEKQGSTRILSGYNDQTVQAEIRRQNNFQWVLQQIIEKSSYRDDNPFAKQSKSGSVFIYATPNPANERRMIKMKNYMQLYNSLEEENKQYEVAKLGAMGYNAQNLDSAEPLNHGSCLDYIDTMDEDQQAFIKNYQQWKDNVNQQALEHEDGIPISSATIQPPTLQELMLRKSKLVTELRHQLNIANERQKKAGEKGDWILAKLAAKLKRDSFAFAPIVDHTTTSMPPPPPSSSSPSYHHIDTTDNRDSTAQSKKRRILGIPDDEEMYKKANFDFFKKMSTFK